MRGLVAGLGAFVVFLAAQCLLYHLVTVRRKLYVMLWLWAGAYLVYVPLFRALPDDAAWLPDLLAAPGDAVTWVSGALVHWFLFAGYYQFFNMADNSVGVRSLIELARGPAHGLALADLRTHYDFDRMLGRRLERLVAAGYLRKDGARYRSTDRGRRAARLMRALKGLLNLGPGG